MTLTYLVDGELFDASEASVNVRDRGFLYGDAAFETMRVYAGELFAWEAHMDRLDATCRLLDIDHGIDSDTLYEWVMRVLAENDLQEAAIRLSITRGIQPGALRPTPAVDPTVVIIVRELGRSGIEGQPRWETPATVYSASRHKIPDSAIPAAAKTHNYLSGVLAHLDLPDDGDEALLRTVDGSIAEGTISNLFLVDEGRLLTPGEESILPGITRYAVMVLAELLEIEVSETPIQPAMLTTVDEAFLTNTTWEIRPIESVDGHHIGEGRLTRRLRTAFDTAIEANFYEAV